MTKERRLESGVYAIIHDPTGMTYIGYSKRVYVRLQAHRSKCNRGKDTCPLLQKHWTSTEGKDWSSKVLVSNPEDPEESEIQEILKIPEHLRLNIIVAHTGGGISNERGRVVQSKRMVERLRATTKSEYHGVSLKVYQKPGENYVYRSWRFRVRRNGISYSKSGFSTAEEAYAARKKYLLEHYGESV